jgi:capsid protein
MGGATISSLAPGRELKVLADTRPGPNTLQFIDKLEDQLSDSAGLDNNAVFNLGNANSANVRLVLENNRGWREKRHQWARPMLQWMYRFFMAAEIAAGRLDLPKEGYFDQVDFVPCRDLTIDWGRYATAAINLKREGLMSAKDFVQSAFGKTMAEVAADNAEMLAIFRELEEKYDLPAGSLQQAALGATDVNRAAE